MLSSSYWNTAMITYIIIQFLGNLAYFKLSGKKNGKIYI